jgi:hypothetical protein
MQLLLKLSQDAAVCSVNMRVAAETDMQPTVMPVDIKRLCDTINDNLLR